MLGSLLLTAVVLSVSGADSTHVRVDTAKKVSVRECDHPQPGWIWCDDFETDRLAKYFEYVNPRGQFIRDSTVGINGSWGMRVRYVPGESDAGSLKVAFGKTPAPYFRTVDSGTARYKEIYWRVYVRNQPGWRGGGGDKLSRALVFVTPKWAEAAFAHVWSGSSETQQNKLVLDPASGTDEAGNVRTTTYNDSPNMRWLGEASGWTPLFDATHVGRWYCVEAHARLNDPGQSNGVFELWINGELQTKDTGLNWVGSFVQYGFNAIFFENYWNAGPPVAQERYLDNIVISGNRIGCPY